MANNITILDGNGSPIIVKSTDNGGIQTPSHNVEAIIGALPAGSNNIGKVTPETNGSDVTVNNPFPVVLAKGSFTDRSGTVTTGGSAQQVAPSNANRRYIFFQNLGNVNLWINFGVAAIQNQPSILVPPGTAFCMETGFICVDSLSVIGANTGTAFTCKEG